MLIKFKRKQKWEAGEDNGNKVSRRRKTFNYLSNTWEGQIKKLTTISGPLKGKPSLQCDKKKKGTDSIMMLPFQGAQIAGFLP